MSEKGRDMAMHFYMEGFSKNKGFFNLAELVEGFQETWKEYKQNGH